MKTQKLPPTPSGRRRWTREEFEFIDRAGLLNGRYELLDGEIIKKRGQNRPHALTLSLIIAWVYQQFDPRRIQTQATMEVREEDRVTIRDGDFLSCLTAPTNMVAVTDLLP